MARINVEVGAKLASSFKSTLSSIRDNVSNLAGELAAPFVKVAGGASVATVAIDHVKEAIVSRVLGPVGALAYGIGAVNLAMWAMAKASDAVGGGLEKFSKIEDLEGAFRPLLGSATAARQRLADLATFAAETPYDLPGAANASRVLEVLTRGALSTGAGLRMVGDVAAATGTPFQEMAMWVGRAYDGLQSGRPIGEAAMRLQELGVLSGETRNKLEALQKAGKSGAEVWGVLKAELDRTKGSMETLSQTMTGLRSTLQDTKDALYRSFGKSFAEHEKETITAATEVLEKMAPVAEHVGEVLNDLSVGDTPGEWFPIFDVEIKKMAASALSATGFIKGLFDAAVLAGGALGSMVVAATLQSLWAFYGACKANIVATQAFIAAQKTQQIVWEFNFVSIVKNTRALAGNAIAQGRSAASAYLQAGAMVFLRTVTESVTASVRALTVALFANPWTLLVGAIAATAASMYFYLKSVTDAAARQGELAQASTDLINGLSKQRQEIATTADRAKFLAGAYEQLKKAQDELRNAPEADRTALQNRIAAIQAEIRGVEKLSETRLKAGDERARLEKELKDLQEQAASKDMTASDRLTKALEEQNKALQEQAELRMNLRRAEGAGSASEDTIRKFQIGEQQKAYRKAQQDEDAAKAALPKAQADADWLGGDEMEELKRAAEDATRRKAEALKAIQAIQDRKAAIPGQIEAARTAIAASDKNVFTKDQAVTDARKEMVEENEKRHARLDELAVEAKLLQLKSTGAQRLMDEFNLQRALLEQQYQRAQMSGDEVKAVEVQNRYWGSILKIQQGVAQSRKDLTDAKQNRRDQIEQRIVDQMTPEQKTAYLGAKQREAYGAASTLTTQAAAARKAGREGDALDLEKRAEEARAKGDGYGFQYADLLKRATLRPVTDNLTKIGGGGFASREGKDPALVAQENATKATKDLTKQIDQLNRQLGEKRPPGTVPAAFAK
jgi:hypothetical protein